MMRFGRLLALVMLLGGTLSLLVGTAPAQPADDFKIIVNSSNPVGSMAAKDVSKLFLKKKNTWDNGTKVQPVDLPVTSQTRKAFSQGVHNKPAAKINSYWQGQVFSGRASPPPEKKTDAEVVSYVRANPGAIGYVSGDTTTEGVKVLEVY